MLYFFYLLRSTKAHRHHHLPGSRYPPLGPRHDQVGHRGGRKVFIYISQELAKLGYKVSVFGNAPLNSAYSGVEANPRFVPHQPVLGSKFDIGIAWRMPGSAEDLGRSPPEYIYGRTIS